MSVEKIVESGKATLMSVKAFCSSDAEGLGM